MNNFIVLYRYETKKLFSRKIVRSALVLCIAAIIISLCIPFIGSYYAEGELTDTSSDIQTTNVIPQEQPNENDSYTERQLWLNSMRKNLRLSKGEMDFWQKRESQIKKPFTWKYHEAYDILISCYQTVGLLVMFLIAICLSGTFSEDHALKTDQIILCSALGKTRLYWVKIMVGVSFSVFSAVLLSVVTFIMAICLYSPDGFHAAFQLIYAGNSDPVTCGQAVLIAFVNMIFAAIITGIFVMVLSELLHSNIATLAVYAGLLVTAMIVSVPEQYRLLAQIWDWLPWCFIAPWNVFGDYTLSITGYYFAPWQIMPVIYLIAGMACAGFGYPLYKRFRIS